MKKIIFTAAILIGCLSFKTADAQLRINLGFNIGSQPEWGPVGYAHAEYYYMPDIDTYYDVPNHQYVYYQNNAWVRAGSLPPRYHDYDLYHGYKVVVNQPNPWQHSAEIRAKYSGYRGRHDQPIIRESHDQKYSNHWNGDRGNNGNGHGNGRGNNGRDNGRGNNGYDRGNGNGNNGHDNGKGHDNK